MTNDTSKVDTPLLNDAQLLLVYDKECPACNNYCKMVRIRESVGQLQLVDAREDTPIMQEITAAGLDIDDGMVLKMGDQLYYGSDAIHALSLISSKSGIFNKLNYWVFKSKRVSHVVYPMMRAGRAVLLKLLRKTKINNLDVAGNDRF